MMGRRRVAERTDFTAALAHSALPGAELVAGLQAADWNQALRSLALAVPDNAPSIAVIDEVPWLVDLIGADREPVAGAVHFIGSVKWLESQPFGRREYDALVRDALAVPGADPDTPLVAVSRSGVTDGLPLAAHWAPEDLVDAWR